MRPQVIAMQGFIQTLHAMCRSGQHANLEERYTYPAADVGPRNAVVALASTPRWVGVLDISPRRRARPTDDRDIGFHRP
jgi:hypothetical protein